MHLKGGNKMDEVELVKAVQQGDRKAFEALFQKYKDQAIRTAYLMSGHPQLAEDIVQEAFTTCYLSLNKLKKPECFRAWFFKLLTRIAWRSLKKEKCLVPTEDIGELIEQAYFKGQTTSLDQQYEYETLYDNISKLSYPLQTTLILYYYNELTLKEIAKVMGCLEGTVKSRLHTARKKLKLHLLEQEESKLRKVVG